MGNPAWLFPRTLPRSVSVRPVGTEELGLWRESRQALQKRLLQNKDSVVISFSINWPGPLKRCFAADRAFAAGLTRLYEVIKACKLETAQTEVRESECGCDLGIRILSADPQKLKQMCVELEEESQAARLFDFDVLDASGRKIERSDLGLPPRTCLICSQNAILCARSRAHSWEELSRRAEILVREQLRASAADYIAELGLKAILHELSAAPKPGLVDRFNSGSHRDMDYFSFLNSSLSLHRYFHGIAMANYCDNEPELFFEKARTAGLEAEIEMLKASGGANTQKGLIYSFTFLIAAFQRLLRRTWEAGESGLPSILELTREAALLARIPVLEFKQKFPHLDVDGARAEAAAAYPLSLMATRVLQRERKMGRDINGAMLLSLLELLAVSEDKNLLHRGGPTALQEARSEAKLFLESYRRTGDMEMQRLQEFDRRLIAEGLSPGGSADLLALALFLYFYDSENETGLC